jgi:hypothetical protein
VTFTVPAADATGVSRTADISATFDQPVTGVTSGSVLVSTALGSALGTVSYNPGGQDAVFSPSPPLPAGALVTVFLTNAIHNSVGVPFSGYTFMFTTIDDQPPTLASSIPLDLATMVPTSSTIEITFSEAVTGVSITSFTVAQGVTAIAGTIVANTTSDYTFTPTAALPATSTITVSLSAAIQDLPGNALVPVQFTFMTQ